MRIFKRKGIYIGLIVLSTLVLAAALYFSYSISHQLPMESQMPYMQQSEAFQGFEPKVQTQYPLPERLTLILMIASAATFVFSAIMLVVLSINKKHQSAQDAAEKPEEDDFPVRKKNLYGYYLIIIVAAVVLFSVLVPEQETESSGLVTDEKLFEVVADSASIDVMLRSGGAVAENTARQISLAGDISVEQWLVSAGDYVEKDQAVALADRDSVILSIAELTELMSQLDEEINSSFSDAVSNAIYAPASGRVKAIHAVGGVDVQETVSEHGALIRLSLDGLMAADLEETEGMYTGMPVLVQRQDGSILDGSIEKLMDGVATLIVPDELAGYGESVRVYDTQGGYLGESSLYIHKEICITGIAGTVARINVTENMPVGTDMALLILENTAFSGQRDILTAKRRQMEEELTALFSVYNSGCINAPCNGRIAAINEDISVEALSSADSSAPAQIPEMKSYAVSVVEVEGSLITVAYTDTAASVSKEINLESALVFKYENGSYHPCTSSEIKAGDSLVLGMYTDTSGQESIDHIILYPSTFPGEAGGQQGSAHGGASGSSPGGMASGSGGMGGSGGSSSAMSVEGAEVQTETDDPYELSKTILAYITPFDIAEISVNVDETDVSSYYIGQKLEVSFDALPAQSFVGTVSKIDPNGINEDGGSTKYALSVQVERSPDMLTGMNASTAALLETVEAEVAIPLAALCEENGECFVYTGYDEKNDVLTEPVYVTTGVSDGEKVQILSGLEKGQRYYYRYAESLKFSY